MVRKRKNQELKDEGRGVPETLTTFAKQREMPKGEKVRAIPRIGNIQPVFSPVVQQALPELDEDARTRLYISLLTHGLQTPVTLVQMGEDYIVLDGHERLELWANILADMPDWSPPLPLRADVIPIAAIVGEELNTARCDCLLAARAISINVARRQLDDTSVESIIKTHLMREWNDAEMQRTSNWLASDLGCSPNWVTQIRRRMWHDKDLPMPPTLEGKKGARVNPDWKKKETTPEPAGHQVGAKDLPISPEELEDKEVETPAPQRPRGPLTPEQEEAARKRAEAEADRLIKAGEQSVPPSGGTTTVQQAPKPTSPAPNGDEGEPEHPDAPEHPAEHAIGHLGEAWHYINAWNMQRKKPLKNNTLLALAEVGVFPVQGKELEEPRVPGLFRDRWIDVATDGVLALSQLEKPPSAAVVSQKLREVLTPWLGLEDKPKGRAKK